MPAPHPPSILKNKTPQVHELQAAVEALTAEVSEARSRALWAEDSLAQNEQTEVDVQSVERAAREQVAAARADYGERLERTRAAESTRAHNEVSLVKSRLASETEVRLGDIAKATNEAGPCTSPFVKRRAPVSMCPCIH